MAAEETQVVEYIEGAADNPLGFHRTALDTFQKVRAEMARIYRRAKMGKMRHDQARSLIWMLDRMRATLEAEEKSRLVAVNLNAGAMNDDAGEPTSLPATAALLESLVREAEASSGAAAGQDGPVLPAAVPAEPS